MKLRIAEMDEAFVRPKDAIIKLENDIKQYLRQNKNLNENDYKISHDSRFIKLEIQGNVFRFIIDRTEKRVETRNKILNSNVLNDYNGNLTYVYDVKKNKHYLFYNDEKLFEIVNVRLTKTNTTTYERDLYSNDLNDLVTVGDKSFMDVMKTIKAK